MDRKRLLPRLRHERWMGWTELPSRALLSMPIKGLPRVGVGEDTRERFTFVQYADMAAHVLADFEAIAVANLAKRPGHWTVKEKSKGFLGVGSKPLRLEFADEHSAERILDQHFMRKASELLGSKLLLVAIPIRGIMWVRAASTDATEVGDFLAGARHVFEQVPAGIEPITPVVLTVDDGKLTGAVGGVAGDRVSTDEEIEPARGFPWPVQGGPEESDDDDDDNDDSNEAGEVDPDEDARRLHAVGFIGDVVEYSCYVEPGEQIPEDQVRYIAQLVAARTIGKRGFETVRISCPDLRVAEQIAPQIRPTGASIVYMNAAGEDVPL